MLEFEKLDVKQLVALPYKHLVIEDFIKPKYLTKIVQAFPSIVSRGSFPLESLKIEPLFKEFTGMFFGDELKRITEKKFDIDLSGAHGMMTLRGFTGERDGRVHIDSKGKIITFLLYLNEDWHDNQGGNLRILNGASDIEDFAYEIQAKFGTLVVFECSANAWHGHKPFVGQRKSLQFNYVNGISYLLYEKYRHHLSAFAKKCKAAFSA